MTSIACELKEEFANKQTEIPCIIVGCIKMADFKTLRIRNWAIVCLAKCVSLVEVFLSLIEMPKFKCMGVLNSNSLLSSLHSARPPYMWACTK